LKQKYKDALDSVRETKTVHKDKEIELEKGDFQALCKAAFAVYGKIFLGALLLFTIVICLLTFFWV
jgi:hypothetical protein